MNVLSGKTAIITGAAKGIGRGIALEMARAGANLILVDNDAIYLPQTESLIKEITSHVFSISADIREEGDIKHLVELSKSQYGHIDILVNNAGIYPPGSSLDMSLTQMEDVFQTNVFGPFLLAREVSRDMISQNIHGSLLYTSSTHARITLMRPAYSASKAALEMIVKESALEMSQYHIRVNAVAPGIIAVLGESDLSNTLVPLGHSGVPEDIGKVMVFLASEAAGYITGEVITVDGGFSISHTHYFINQGSLKPV